MIVCFCYSGSSLIFLRNDDGAEVSYRTTTILTILKLLFKIEKYKKTIFRKSVAVEKIACLKASRAPFSYLVVLIIITSLEFYCHQRQRSALQPYKSEAPGLVTNIVFIFYSSFLLVAAI